MIFIPRDAIKLLRGLNGMRKTLSYDNDFILSKHQLLSPLSHKNFLSATALQEKKKAAATSKLNFTQIHSLKSPHPKSYISS